ncbi:MAG: threonylcarbamoyl-AMP synthase [Deltaproteobacteria bacterium]|nr:threonylcarbamoyl-AMP synthase [Deltaproteobacteria bacterium]
MKSCEILSVDPESPDPDSITRAAALIKTGGLVIFPTSSFYGIGAPALDAEAVDRVFQVKKRDPEKPLLILIASLTDLDALVQLIPGTATRLMKAFWPGSLTLVFEAADRLPRNLTGYTKKIGIRLARHPVAISLTKGVGAPITGTSANLSGQAACSDVADLAPRFLDQVDLVVDAGRLGGGKGSTVVDVTADPPKILREGGIDAAKIQTVLKG